MVDDRTYIKVHDGIEDHPKIVILSDKAFRVLVTTWAWSSRHTTDGFIPEAVWQMRATAKVRAELEAGLVHRTGHGCTRCPSVPDGHVKMHDYLEHQRSAEEIEEFKEIKSRAGRVGNHKRWHVEHGITDPGCEFCAIADGSQDRSHVRSQKRSQKGRKTSPETETETEELPPSLRSGGPRKRGSRIPDDFAASPEMVAWARERVPNVDGRLETEKFINYWQAKSGSGATKVDWVATWRNWMLSAGERAPTRTNGHVPYRNPDNPDVYEESLL